MSERTARRWAANIWARPETKQARIAWAVATTIAALVFSLIVFTVWPDDSDGATARPEPASSTSRHAVAPRLCAPEPGAACPSRYVSRFNAGTYGNSHGLLIPLKVRKMLRALDARVTARTGRRDFGDWWDSTLGYGRCISHKAANLESGLNCIGTDDGQKYLDAGPRRQPVSGRRVVAG
jgi:hypothetical protein